jgi:hypothetical protein
MHSIVREKMNIDLMFCLAGIFYELADAKYLGIKQTAVQST